MDIEDNSVFRKERALARLSNKINDAFGFSEEQGYEGPRINLGPCGPFAFDFLRVWNNLSRSPVHIVFVMKAKSDECWHIAIRLSNGKLFDGGIGIHNDKHYDSKDYYLEDMTQLEMTLLEQRSYGLNRSYPRHCPNFDRDLMRKIIVEQLEWLFFRSEASMSYFVTLRQ